MGPLTAPALIAIFHQGHFRSVDALIALGRKLARVTFALLAKEVDFDPQLRAAG